MTFSISQKTLERLEWPQILALLRAHACTPRGRSELGDSRGAESDGAPEATSNATDEPAPRDDPLALHLFASSREDAENRLAETSEARAILQAGDLPPLHGIVELAAILLRARKGGILSARELLDLRTATIALCATARFLGLRRESAPLLAGHAETIADFGDLAFDIDAALDSSGDVRDDATTTLADARREARRLDAEIQASLDRYLRDSDVTARLSDRYFTVRNDRYVLPVRADSRGGFGGIVHDVSGSGTTLFIEPERLVGLNNRHRQAELAIERETRRILRDLSGAVGRAADDIETAVDRVTNIDLAFARAHLAEQMNATSPEVLHEGVMELPLLRHPLLPDEDAVPNDLRLGRDFRVLVISGPNAGGKTVAMKAAALAALFVRAGLHVPASTGARVDFFDAVHADIGDEQDIRENLSTFSGHMANLARIVDVADRNSLVVLDELGMGTDPGEGSALAQAALEALADAGARVIVTTHYNLLKEMAEVDTRFANASVDFDERTLEPTFRLRFGVAGSSSATAVASRMGLRSDVVERAASLLEREDRQLDRMLSELAASRSALEREQLEAKNARFESEVARNEYRKKLEDLRDRREKLFRAMREDLDHGFRDAHAQIAAVIRDLQRGGTARDAAHARERLQQLDARAKSYAAETGFNPEREPRPKVDWRRAHAGDIVRIEGGNDAVLLALPDKRGRVAIRQGSARVVVSTDRVIALRASPNKQNGSLPAQTLRPAVRVDTPSSADFTSRVDLRGLRVDEALDVLDEALDRAISADRNALLVVHGIGSGALRRAVREHLHTSPYVASFENAESGEGGDGATVVHLC